MRKSAHFQGIGYLIVLALFAAWSCSVVKQEDPVQTARQRLLTGHSVCLSKDSYDDYTIIIMVDPPAGDSFVIMERNVDLSAANPSKNFTQQALQEFQVNFPAAGSMAACSYDTPYGRVLMGHTWYDSVESIWISHTAFSSTDGSPVTCRRPVPFSYPLVLMPQSYDTAS
ncbi:MAG: hypothetical protein EHM64_16330 [Ignavibacteriae bacterium]|nr:MAG: hypothetical protein EHM64_16330 [Ignavibacteriota bacterium]